MSGLVFCDFCNIAHFEPSCSAAGTRHGVDFDIPDKTINSSFGYNNKYICPTCKKSLSWAAISSGCPYCKKDKPFNPRCSYCGYIGLKKENEFCPNCSFNLKKKEEKAPSPKIECDSLIAELIKISDSLREIIVKLQK